MRTHWTEKYRPTTLDDCLVSDNLKTILKSFVAQEEMPNILLYGVAGISKTTMARVLASEMGAEVLRISGSLEGRNIDTVRRDIVDFVTTHSIKPSKFKIVLVDEADYIGEAAQPALRTVMEDYEKDVRFIFTCNYVNRIIDPVRSRFKEINVNNAIPNIRDVLKRMFHILDVENVEYDKRAVGLLVKERMPDIRRIVTELYTASLQGSIDSSVLIEKSLYTELLTALKKKNFSEIREWTSKNAGIGVYDDMYEQFLPHLKESCHAEFVIVLHDYMYKSQTVLNKEINLTAFLAEMCRFAVWK